MSYEEELILRAYKECSTFVPAGSTIDFADLETAMENILWKDLSYNGLNVWALLEATGDKTYNEESFKKAARMVINNASTPKK